jgi:hypothetical protein
MAVEFLQSVCVPVIAGTGNELTVTLYWVGVSGIHPLVFAYVTVTFRLLDDPASVHLTLTRL